MNYSAEMLAALNEVSIPNVENIRGNLFLPEMVGGVSVQWKSSRPEVITDKAIGRKKPGIICRGTEDTAVTLTALLTIGEERAEKDITVCVKAKSEQGMQDEMEGYLFCHFIGEGRENEEQLYFALSESGLHFKDLNGGVPVLVSRIGEKGVRDPYITRSVEGDRYFIVATDLSIYNRGGWFQNAQGYYDASTTGSHYLVLWESEDLINWGEPKLLDVAPENAGMAWAPEMVYDEETGDYVIFFASSIMNPETKMKAKPNAIYYVATRDFVHFTKPEIFIDNQTDPVESGKVREIIDTTVLKIGGYYYAASKDGDNAEENGGIRIHRNKSLLDAKGWEKVLDLDELKLDISSLRIGALDNHFLEGPELFEYIRKDRKNPDVPEYGIIADQYAIGGGYVPLKTTDIEDADNSRQSWSLVEAEEYSFDRLKKRHGSIMPITKAEIERIKKAYDK